MGLEPKDRYVAAGIQKVGDEVQIKSLTMIHETIQIRNRLDWEESDYSVVFLKANSLTFVLATWDIVLVLIVVKYT